MKFIFSFLLLIAAFVVVSAFPILAQESNTRVRGNVYNMNAGGQGIGGLTVTVTCNGIVKTGVTDSFGLYVVDYAQEECGRFTRVTSQVTFNGEPQSQTVFVSHNFRATLDFYYGSTSVPEFGAITGIVTAVGSGLAYLGLKRKLSH